MLGKLVTPSPHLLLTLGRHDDVELEGGVNRSDKAPGRRVVAVARVSEDAVEHDVGVFGDRTHVVRQPDEERNLGRLLCRQSCN